MAQFPTHSLLSLDDGGKKIYEIFFPACDASLPFVLLFNAVVLNRGAAAHKGSVSQPFLPHGPLGQQYHYLAAPLDDKTRVS